MPSPLADRIRPETLDDVVGQTDLCGKSGILRKIAASGKIPNMIFYGPSGVGKTTVARILCGMTGKKLYKLNGTSASTADIREIIAGVGTIDSLGGVVLYLDEIQYLNKKQQQSLLEYIENGDITLIASTTENPYFYIYSAILSRCTVFQFHPITKEDVMVAVSRAYRLLEEETGKTVTVPEKCVEFIAVICGGDVRKALNAVELSVSAAEEKKGKVTVTMALLQSITGKSGLRYDRSADEHYNVISAYQKAMRGSDPDAALHYLARLLESGDLQSACRRLLVTASEDVGLAFPQCISIVKACVDSAFQLGLPEAAIPLAEAVVLVATAPKSNSTSEGIMRAMEDVRSGLAGDVPAYLKDSHYGGAVKMGHGEGYQYPHAFSNNYVKQNYLPDVLAGRQYYEYGTNKYERSCEEYWKKIKE